MRSVGWTFLASLLVALGCGPSSPGEVQLAPPKSGQGWQWQVADFSVASGTEVQACYFFAVPGTPGQDVWVDHVTVAQNAGSHHMNIFRVKTVIGLGGNPGDSDVDVVSATGQLLSGSGQCFKSPNWADWPLVINSQDAQTVDWKLPDSVGWKFQAGELLMLQTHYVNLNTQKTPGKGKVLANFDLAQAAPASELGTLFATDQNIRICPGDTNKSFESHCTFPPATGGGPASFTIVGANGHFHSRGVDFTIATLDSAGAVGSQFYESKTWAEPPMARGLDIAVPAGGGIDYRCTFTCDATMCGNPKDSCCFTFGGHVDMQEHCNAFVYYYPKIQDITCF